MMTLEINQCQNMLCRHLKKYRVNNTNCSFELLLNDKFNINPLLKWMTNLSTKKSWKM
jgi:hypothetical protein